ncbi:MAG TPA: diguanylate cyclase [Leptospiraceae bacterium]|nr:diguanylate cyclase [Leptospiraceae bacterium]HMW04940.1 diguanylate cyclase [Leptospiraceae bacterium]HMX31911.1 diguanylate cyclase [Leptospiraceae bacterium]HMY30839.1 diguanylate cyclase [Leptospiraceae bacterium]HMZ62643.1 diguanylate cyclase [Leptospiraceae bacterium]
MSFLQKALKLLQDFPNFRNQNFQVEGKKKKSFLKEAENFFKNLNSTKDSANDLDEEKPLSDNKDTLVPEDLDSNPDSLSFNEGEVVSAPVIPTEFNEEDNIVVDLDQEEIIVQENNITSNENVEVNSIDDYTNKVESLDEFSGDTQTLELDEDTVIVTDEEQSQELESNDILEDWERDAQEEALPEIEAVNEETKPTEEQPNPSFDSEIVEIEPNAPIDSETIVDVNVEDAFDSAKQFKTSYEEKLESYLVLFEITKELLKSKSFDDFFENLMYSIISQIAPEIMIIFSSRDGNFSQMKIVAHEGIDIEPDYVIKKGDTLYTLLESETNVLYARDLLDKNLKDRERVLLENPLTELLIPIRVLDQFSGFIVAGKMISGEDYSEKDLEFLRILVEVSGNFLSKLFDSENLANEVSELNKIINSSSLITDFTDKVYTTKTLDELYDVISENLVSDFKVSNFTFMILDVKTMDYKVFGSNFLLPETVDRFKLSKDSKIITMIAQVSDVYRLENFQDNFELKSLITEQEIAAMTEFTVIPLINIGRMVGLFIIHKVLTDWSPGFKKTILSLSNIVAPIIANLVMQNEKESLFRNPFNPILETIDREIKYSESKNKQFTLVVLKILNVTRILNILGINFFSDYSDFISKKIFENIKSSDYVSRIGQGKFAILLKENSKSDSEKFIEKIKSEIVLFHNPSRDFKLSIQIYSLTFPDQARERRKFVEMMEET